MIKVKIQIGSRSLLRPPFSFSDTIRPIRARPTWIREETCQAERVDNRNFERRKDEEALSQREYSMANDFREVWSVMRGNVRTVEPTDRLDLANVVMKLGGIRHLPVVEEGVLIGVVSQRDLLSAALSSALEPSPEDALRLRTVLVEDVMTRDPHSVGINTPLRDAAATLLRQQIGCLPVVDEAGRLIGLVSETDLIRGAYDLEANES